MRTRPRSAPRHAHALIAMACVREMVTRPLRRRSFPVLPRRVRWRVVVRPRVPRKRSQPRPSQRREDEVEQLADARARTESIRNNPPRSNVEAVLAPVAVRASTTVPATTIATPSRASGGRPSDECESGAHPELIMPTTIGVRVRPAWVGDQCSRLPEEQTRSSRPPNAPKRRARRCCARRPRHAAGTHGASPGTRRRQVPGL